MGEEHKREERREQRRRAREEEEKRSRLQNKEATQLGRLQLDFSLCFSASASFRFLSSSLLQSGLLPGFRGPGSSCRLETAARLTLRSSPLPLGPCAAPSSNRKKARASCWGLLARLRRPVGATSAASIFVLQEALWAEGHRREHWRVYRGLCLCPCPPTLRVHW